MASNLGLRDWALKEKKMEEAMRSMSKNTETQQTPNPYQQLYGPKKNEDGEAASRARSSCTTSTTTLSRFQRGIRESSYIWGGEHNIPEDIRYALWYNQDINTKAPKKRTNECLGDVPAQIRKVSVKKNKGPEEDKDARDRMPSTPPPP